MIWRFSIDGRVPSKEVMERLDAMVRKPWGYGELLDAIGWMPVRYETHDRMGEWIDVDIYSTPEPPVRCRNCGAPQ
jgi:hypothetical protein